MSADKVTVVIYFTSGGYTHEVQVDCGTECDFAQNVIDHGFSMPWGVYTRYYPPSSVSMVEVQDK